MIVSRCYDGEEKQRFFHSFMLERENNDCFLTYQLSHLPVASPASWRAWTPYLGRPEPCARTPRSAPYPPPTRTLWEELR